MMFVIGVVVGFAMSIMLISLCTISKKWSECDDDRQRSKKREEQEISAGETDILCEDDAVCEMRKER